MKKYIFGFFKYLFYSNISLFSIIDYRSKINKKSAICRRTKVLNSSIKRYTYIGVNSSVVYSEIGAFTSVADNVMIGLGNHLLDRLSTSPIFTESNHILKEKWCTTTINKNIYSKIYVGNDVWIGSKAVIMGGGENRRWSNNRGRLYSY